MKKLIFIAFSFLIGLSAFAHEIELNLTSYPNIQQLRELEHTGMSISLTICCSYPGEKQLEALKYQKINSLTVEAGHFPSLEDLNILNKLSYPIKLKLSEVFPSEQDVELINQSRIAFITVTSEDFPTTGEVNIFNLITRPLLFDILKKEMPTEEHMVVIRQFRKDVRVGFHNPVPPGPGYANFYNSLSSPKVFTITDKFPYGDDPVGMNLVEKSSYRIAPEQQLMEVDIPTLVRIQKETIVELSFHPILNQDYFSLLNKISQHKLVLKADRTSELLNDQTMIWASGQKNVVFSFRSF